MLLVTEEPVIPTAPAPVALMVTVAPAIIVGTAVVPSEATPELIVIVPAVPIDAAPLAVTVEPVTVTEVPLSATGPPDAVAAERRPEPYWRTSAPDGVSVVPALEVTWPPVSVMSEPEVSSARPPELDAVALVIVSVPPAVMVSAAQLPPEHQGVPPPAASPAVEPKLEFTKARLPGELICRIVLVLLKAENVSVPVTPVKTRAVTLAIV